MKPTAEAPVLSDGRYALTRRLGEGGMATVFLAWDNKLKVWRAVKVLLPHVSRKRKLRKRFENEAHAMARVEHPNVVRVYDVGLEGGVPYMVMELAEGGCIIDWLARFGAMPPRLAVDVIVQVCKGIRVAHEAGIVHRDVKPHNILVNRNGTCKVTDFGIAQMDSESLTKTGSVMGTWGYMAPEQRTDAKNVDEKADVFSIGATLYSLLTNKTPTELYVADDDDEVFEGIPAELLTVIMKACAYKPSERYSDVRTLGMAVHKAGTTQPKVPPSTPSLVLISDPLPESVESAPLSSTIVEELRAAIGVQRTTLPDDESDPITAKETPSAKSRVLPYYMPSEPSTRPPPTPRKPIAGVPSYIDAAEFERQERQERRPPTPPPVVERAPEPAPSPGGVDLLVKLAAIPALLLVMVIGLLGWGMIRVNGAHDTTNSRAQQLFIQMQQQGPVVDALARGGADRATLEALYYAYEESEPANRGRSASTYIAAVEKASSALDREAQSALGTTLDGMSTARSDFETAQAAWGDTASGFPGVLAVTIGLSSAP